MQKQINTVVSFNLFVFGRMESDLNMTW